MVRTADADAETVPLPETRNHGRLDVAVIASGAEEVVEMVTVCRSCAGAPSVI